MYHVQLDETENTTAHWLDNHGYFGDFFKHARLVEVKCTRVNCGHSDYDHESINGRGNHAGPCNVKTIAPDNTHCICYEFVPGMYYYEIDEPGAWSINEYVESDYHAFLACNGSHSLAEKMLAFLNSIV